MKATLFILCAASGLCEGPAIEKHKFGTMADCRAVETKIETTAPPPQRCAVEQAVFCKQKGQSVIFDPIGGDCAFTLSHGPDIDPEG